MNIEIVAHAISEAILAFYKATNENNLAIKISVYQISADYEEVIDEIHYSNLGDYLKHYTTAVKNKIAGG